MAQHAVSAAQQIVAHLDVVPGTQGRTAAALAWHAHVFDEKIHQRVEVAHVQRDRVFRGKLTDLVECLEAFDARLEVGERRHERSPADISAASRTLSILLVVVYGKLSASASIAHLFGTLYAAIWLRHAVTRSSAVAVRPSLSTTAALTIAPLSGSGIPTT